MTPICLNVFIPIGIIVVGVFLFNWMFEFPSPIAWWKKRKARREMPEAIRTEFDRLREKLDSTAMKQGVLANDVEVLIYGLNVLYKYLDVEIHREPTKSYLRKRKK